MQEPTLDEKIQKFIDQNGYNAWVELLSQGKVPSDTPDKPKGGASSVAETVKNFLQR